MKKGNKVAAKELYKVVSVLGTNDNSDLIVKRIRDKYFPAAASGDASLGVLAHKVMMYRSVCAAKALLHRAGGDVQYRRKKGWLSSTDEIVVYFDGIEASVQNEGRLAEWVADNVAPR